MSTNVLPERRRGFALPQRVAALDRPFEARVVDQIGLNELDRIIRRLLGGRSHTVDTDDPVALRDGKTHYRASNPAVSTGHCYAHCYSKSSGASIDISPDNRNRQGEPPASRRSRI